MSSEQPDVSEKDLLADPRYYLFDTLPQSGQTRFLITNERELADAAFADIRYEPKASGDHVVNSRDLVELVANNPIERPNTCFIFHHAFVCSTLLARCLNEIPAFYALKEPWIMRRLADIKRQQAGGIPEAHWQQMLQTYMALLAKRYKTGETLVIKATNVANNLIYDVRGYFPDQPILYLYSDIKSFLTSNLKKSIDTQRKMPGLLAQFIMDSDIATKFEANGVGPKRTLLQTCALIWACNTYTVRQAGSRYGSDRLSCLDMDEFLTKPANSLQAVCRHFGHTASEYDTMKMTASDVLGRNAKDKRYRYDNAMKSDEGKQILLSNQKEIDEVKEWISPLVDDLGLYDFLHEQRLQQ